MEALEGEQAEAPSWKIQADGGAGGRCGSQRPTFSARRAGASRPSSWRQPAGGARLLRERRPRDRQSFILVLFSYCCALCLQKEAPGAAEEQTMSVFLRVRPFSPEELSEHEDQVAQLPPAAPGGARDYLEYHRCYSTNAGVD